eukprot:110591_1
MAAVDDHEQKQNDDGNIHVPLAKYNAMGQKKGKKKRAHPMVTIVHISDTHLAHNPFKAWFIPKGDILIHSGDFLSESPGTLPIDKSDGEIPKELTAFNKWLSTLPHKYKVVIAGNHEFSLDGLGREYIQKILSNCIYLEDSFVELYGIKIYGSPWTRHIYGTTYAFGDEEESLYKKWNMIPNDTDIVVTHQPPWGVLDRAWQQEFKNEDKCDICNEIHEMYDHWGSKSLLSEIEKRVKPSVHLFGHVHDENGVVDDKQSGVRFINSALDITPVSHTVKFIFDL